MKPLLKPVFIVAAGLLRLGAISSCTKEAKEERAAESAAEGVVDVTEDFCKVLESIKDKDSAKKAIEKMDGIGDQYAKIAEKAKKAGKYSSGRRGAKEDGGENETSRRAPNQGDAERDGSPCHRSGAVEGILRQDHGDRDQDGRGVEVKAAH